MRVKRHGNRDRGAVTVLFAFLSLGVLFVGVLMADVGALYVEGRQLQNGAENASLRIAQTCAVDAAGCSTTAGDALANANAMDGVTQVQTVCGTALGAGCPNGERDRFGCRPLVSTAAPYVQVHTQSRSTDGSALVPSIFGSLVPGFTQSTVGACARASYGGLSSYTAPFPMVMSYCDWNNQVSTYGLSDPPPYPPFPPSSGWTEEHRRVWLQSGGAAGTCTGPAGQQVSGGFGWIDTDDPTTCATSTSVGGWEGSDPGASTQCPLSTYLGRVISIPVFDQVTGTGNTAQYRIMGYAAFYMTGYRGPSGSGYVAPLSARPCTPSEGSCISGYFISALASTGGGTLGGPSMGLVLVRLTG